VRIELEGIENLLITHPRVKEAVVIKKTNGKHEYLYACIGRAEKTGDDGLLVQQLKQYLVERLPNPMIPAAVTLVEKIPRKINGKVDYEKIRELEKEVEKESVLPRDEMEMKLSELWQEILKRETLSINSNFFELGGSSLNVMTLISKIHKEFDVRLSLGDIFNNSTIAGQSEIIGKAKKEKWASIEPMEKKEYYVMSPTQKKIFFTQQMDWQSTAYNMALTVEINGRIENQKFADTFKKLIERHESLRTSFEMVEDEPVQRVHDHVDFEIEYLDGKDEAKKEIMHGFVRPFDLSRAPLLRVALRRTGEEESLLMVDIHHIVSDIVSQEIMLKEFTALYNGESLPPLGIQYKDFPEWQDRSFTSGEMNKQGEFWLSRFKNRDIPSLDILYDYPRPLIRTIDAGDHVDFYLGRELTGKVYGIMEKAGVTLSILLLTVYNILLHRYTKLEDIVIGVVNTGRTHSDLERIIGMFVNDFPLRSYPGKEKTFITFLEEVKEDMLSSYENQDYPLDDLIIDLEPGKDDGGNPLFNVSFNLDNVEKEEVKYTDFEIKFQKNSQEFAKFDLTLYANEDKERINLRFRYATQLFKRSTIETLKNYYIEIFEQVVDNVEITLKDILLSHDFLIPKPKTRDKDGDFIF
jgi:acyl carrier protein